MATVNEKILGFLKEAGVFYYATVDVTADGTIPHVRPLGYIEEYDGKLVLSLSHKPMAQQTLGNPHFEITACVQGRWIRVCGQASPICTPSRLAEMLKHPLLQAAGYKTVDEVGGFELSLKSAVYASLAGEFEQWL